MRAMALSSFLVGAVQMTSAGDRARNLETALRLVGQAADRGAKLVGLPENFSFMGRDEERVGGAETLEGPTIEALRALARQRGVYVLAGSFPERVAEAQQGLNDALTAAPDPAKLATAPAVYRPMPGSRTSTAGSAGITPAWSRTTS